MARHRLLQERPAPAVEAPGPDAGRARAVRARRDRRRGRRRVRAGSLGEALLSVPWVTVVLLALVAVAAVDLLRPAVYAATTTITAGSDSSAARAAVDLTRTDVVDRVEERIELEEAWRGGVRVDVDRADGGPEVLVEGRAGDPRLAALAADTAASLAVADAPEDLTLSAPAEVPTRPVGEGPRWWVVVALPLLLAAALAEHARARRERPGGSPT
ncbi:hypothetical protein ACPYOC_14700 [Ornithinimicrobium sp. W1665]|uniref:hypothetical protein n=1 Tax=Ornithinimicrobium sp. W1665 TaxID=3416666 RepID=UPI003CF928FB